MTEEQRQKAISALHDCMAACNHCFDACLQEENIDHMRACIRLDRECADMCGYLEHALLRNSPFVGELAQACAVICDRCREECGKHDHDHCQQCAEACRTCADVCRQLLA
ncbi:hypothetical protein N781_15645 [Pontibacillus halophilus JSM 076056 = DSM 19796]|uniref:Ferredoxin n=1 Tax=Pontibacillus halophilus JSM 076056 = DSM 19796 TaxID=1385510 RepID=A0A0A5IA72_9BACI|nr:four-helix bundle copper-binding protein [Pontibacillus halophilus]KGX92737.1 hypothetical protein N781_15645 [Pontibacillus halophilus JSM 076056 = DSM 19796]